MAAPRVARGPRLCRSRILVLDQAATKKAAGMREARPAATAAAPPQLGHTHAMSAATEWTREDSNPAFSLQARCASGLHHGPVSERRVQAPAVRPVLFWQHSTQRPSRTCSRGGSPFHPFPGERHGLFRRSSSSGAVSFRCGCRASRRPGLRRAALRCGAGTFLSDRAGSPSAAHGLLDSDWDECDDARQTSRASGPPSRGGPSTRCRHRLANHARRLGTRPIARTGPVQS